MKSHRNAAARIAAFMERAAVPLTANDIVAGAHASISVVRIHLAQFVEDGEAHIAGTRERGEGDKKGGSASTTWLWGPAPEADAAEPLPSTPARTAKPLPMQDRMSRIAIAETLGYTPGLAATTCDGCVNALAANANGQKLRVAECLADPRGDLN